MTSNIEDRIRRGRWLDLLNNPKQIESLCNTEYELNLFKHKIVAEVHVFFSMMHLPTLRSMSRSNEIKGPTSRYETLNEGSHYLENVNKFVKTYKDSKLGDMNDKHVQIVEATLESLGFDLKRQNYAGANKWFIAGRQDTVYYKLLHSSSNRELRVFLNIVEQNIEAAVDLFLKSVGSKLQIICLEDLFEAIKIKNYARVQKCIKKASIIEGSVDLKNTDGISPLHFAVSEGHADIVYLLLASGSDVNQVTDEGLSTLHIAAEKNHEDIVEMLLEYVSSDKIVDFVNARIRSGITPLHMAAKNGSLKIVRSLLSQGAAYDVKDEKGETPREHANDTDVTDLLKLIDEMFEDAKSCNPRIIDKLKSSKFDDRVALLNVCDSQNGKTMFQIYMRSEQGYGTENFIR